MAFRRSPATTAPGNRCVSVVAAGPTAGPDPAEVFISHAGADRAVAVSLRQSIVDAGLRPWASFVDIPVGAAYPERIVEAIGACRAVVLLVSRESMRSEHVYREVVEAASTGKTILPIYIEPDAPVPARLRYYLGSLHRLKLTPDAIGRAGPIVAACLRDRSAWVQEAEAPSLGERFRATRPRAWAAVFAAALAAGLAVWGLQSIWQVRAEGRLQAEADGRPESLALVEVVGAERAPGAGPWRLQVNVTPAGTATAFADLRLLLASRDGDGPGEVFDLTPVLNPAQVGGGQMLSADMPRLGTRLTTCLTLPHPRTGARWRLTAAFAADPGPGGAQSIVYRPVQAARTRLEDGTPCS